MMKTMKERAFKLLGILLLCGGLFLLTLNIIGVVNPSVMRHPVTQEGDRDRGFWPAQKVFVELENAKNIQDPETYLRAVNTIFGKGVKHYWPNPEKENYAPDPHILPSPYAYWPLYLMSKMMGEKAYPFFENVWYQDYRDVIHMGVGWCGQLSVAITHYLNRNGYNASVIGLDGHMIAQIVLEDGREFLLDPDMEVFFPFGLNIAENNIGRVESFYLQAGYSQETARYTAALFDAAGNVVYPYDGPDALNKKKKILFPVIKAITWGIPVLMILFGAFLFLRPSYGRTPSPRM